MIDTPTFVPIIKKKQNPIKISIQALQVTKLNKNYFDNNDLFLNISDKTTKKAIFFSSKTCKYEKRQIFYMQKC